MTSIPEVGRVLDLQIAEQVMGWRHCTPDGFGRAPDANPLSLLHQEVPHYSTDMAAAWQLIAALNARGWHLYDLGESANAGQWVADFGSGALWWYDPDHTARAHAETPALALCRAALLAIAHDNQSK